MSSLIGPDFTPTVVTIVRCDDFGRSRSSRTIRANHPQDRFAKIQFARIVVGRVKSPRFGIVDKLRHRLEERAPQSPTVPLVIGATPETIPNGSAESLSAGPFQRAALGELRRVHADVVRGKAKLADVAAARLQTPPRRASARVCSPKGPGGVADWRKPSGRPPTLAFPVSPSVN